MNDSSNNDSNTKKKVSPSVDDYIMEEFNTASTIELTSNEVPAQNGKSLDVEKGTDRQGKYYTSDVGALLHLVKSSMGSGFLAMPYAFHNAGILLGFIGTVFVGYICTHCTHMIVHCSQELCYQLKKEKLGYADTIENAVKIGANKKFSKYAPLIKWCVNCSMFITYYGVNTVYVILIASSFKQVIENHADFAFNIRWYALVLVVVLIPVGIVKHMKFLVPFSALANILLFVGCTLTLYYILQDLPPISSRPLVVEPTKWPLFFSTALFGMEGIGTVMPIENAMKKPSHFLGCPGVLNIGMSIVATMFVVVGFLGYLKFGDAVEGSITLNLPEDVLAETVKILVALAILFTYGLQLTASIEVVWSGLRDKFSGKNKNTGYYLVRASMIIGTVAIAIAVPNLSPVLSLVGAIGFSSLGLMFPAIAETIMCWDSDKFTVILIKNICLIGICIFAMVSGSITSINEIIKEYSLS